VTEFSRELIANWVEQCDIIDSGDWDVCESQGGRRERLIDLNIAMSLALNLMPHWPKPCWARSPVLPEDLQQEWQRAAYRKAHQLSLRLDAAAKAQRYRPKVAV
jgi:hypothetical protein